MDDLQELANALSNATLHSLPFPKIGGFATPTQNCNLAFRQNYWEICTQLRSYCWQQKCSTEK